MDYQSKNLKEKSHTTEIAHCTSHQTENSQNDTVPWYYADVQLQQETSITVKNSCSI